MKQWSTFTVILAVMTVMILAAPVLTEAAMFMKIGSIAGESQDKDHDKWIDIVAVSPTVTKTTSTKSGISTIQEMTITKSWDMASPLLQTALATGQKLDEVVFHFTDPASGTVIKVQTIVNVTITGIMPGFDAQSGTKTERVTLSFEDMK